MNISFPGTVFILEDMWEDFYGALFPINVS
jgi:hypothetical protein